MHGLLEARERRSRPAGGWLAPGPTIPETGSAAPRGYERDERRLDLLTRSTSSKSASEPVHLWCVRQVVGCEAEETYSCCAAVPQKGRKSFCSSRHPLAWSPVVVVRGASRNVDPRYVRHALDSHSVARSNRLSLHSQSGCHRRSGCQSKRSRGQKSLLIVERRRRASGVPKTRLT